MGMAGTLAFGEAMELTHQSWIACLWTVFTHKNNKLLLKSLSPAVLAVGTPAVLVNSVRLGLFISVMGYNEHSGERYCRL